MTRFQTFDNHRDDLFAIHRAGQSWMLRDALEDASGFAEFAAGAPRDQVFRASYHSGGIFNNLLLWFDHGMEETPQEMTRIALSFRPAEAMMLFES